MTLIRGTIVLTGVMIALLVAVVPAFAQGEAATEIAIRPLAPSPVGSPVTVIVDLHLEGGAPLADAPISLTSTGRPPLTSRTDASGAASFRLPQDLAPREYELVATYSGEAGATYGASDELSISVVPFELTVQTVPSLPGMVFTLDSKRFTADADGVARLSVAFAGDHTLTILENEYRGDGLRALFSRWNTGVSNPQLPIRIPLDKPLQAGFDVQLPASLSFVDLDGAQVDPRRITSITLRDSVGNVVSYPDGRQRLLRASQAVAGPNGLESTEVRYDLEAVEVDGSNVASAGQHGFSVGGSDPWQIKLMLFPAHIQARDALFGFGAGRSVDVSYPGGETVRVKADAGGQIVVPELAHGTYRMTVVDAPGWAPAVQVALSRGQDVVLHVVSYLDMAVAISVAAGLALVTLRLRRRRPLATTVGRSSRRRTAAARQQARLASDGSPLRSVQAVPVIEAERVVAALGTVVSPALRRRTHVGRDLAPPGARATQTPRSRVARPKLASPARVDSAGLANRKPATVSGALTGPAPGSSRTAYAAATTNGTARKASNGAGHPPVATNNLPNAATESKAAKAALAELTTSRAEPPKSAQRERKRSSRTQTAAPSRPVDGSARTWARRSPRIEAPRVVDASPAGEGDPTAVGRGDPRLAARRAQLAALGIDDPGVGPIALRERRALVGEVPLDPTSPADGESCEQCGMPVLSDAPFCRRCGYRQDGPFVLPPLRIADRPEQEPETSTAEERVPKRARARRRPQKAV
ncbi:MAG: hypothetical protein ABJB65_07155 [Chloroflexota bacterium]